MAFGGSKGQEKFRSEISLNQENIAKRISQKMQNHHSLKNNLEITLFLYEQQPRNWQLMLECVCSITEKQQNPGLVVNTA